MVYLHVLIFQKAAAVGTISTVFSVYSFACLFCYVLSGWFVLHRLVLNDVLCHGFAPMLEVSAFERTGSRVACGLLVVLIAAPFAVFPKATCAVAAGASPAFVFIVKVRQADMNNA